MNFEFKELPLPNPYTQTDEYVGLMKSIIGGFWQLLQDKRDHSVIVRMVRLEIKLEQLGLPNDEIFDNILHALDSDTIEMYHDVKDHLKFK